jgi:hypothetical protein
MEMTTSRVDKIQVCTVNIASISFKRRVKSHLPLLSLLGAHHILRVSRIRVNEETLEKLSKLEKYGSSAFALGALHCVP